MSSKINELPPRHRSKFTDILAAYDLEVDKSCVAIKDSIDTFSELADFAVYTPLRERHLTLATVLSGLVGSIVDSVIFLSLAFGSLDFIVGH